MKLKEFDKLGVWGGAVGLALLGLAVGSQPGCSGDRDARDRDGTSGGEAPIEREECLGQGHEERGADVDGDGRLDVVHAFEGERRVCSAFDRDLDGDHDLLRFYEPDGETPTLEIQDLDFDGRVDHVALFADRVRVRQELDTDFDDRIDLFVWCEGGLAARVERIRMGAHRRVDTWEEYVDGYLVAARYDEDGDGEAERFETYRDGLLKEEGLDANRDGTLDDSERTMVEDEFAGRRQRVECGGARAPVERDAGTADAGATRAPDAGAGAAPWERDAGVPDAGSTP